MAAEKLTKARLAQILITLLVLISAFYGEPSHMKVVRTSPVEWKSLVNLI